MSEGGGGILRGSQEGGRRGDIEGVARREGGRRGDIEGVARREGGRRGDIEGVARREGGERCGGKGMMYMRDYMATMFYEPFLHYG